MAASAATDGNGAGRGAQLGVGTSTLQMEMVADGWRRIVSTDCSAIVVPPYPPYPFYTSGCQRTAQVTGA